MRHPRRMWRSVVRHQLADSLTGSGRGGTPMVHVAAFTRANAGDTLLCTALEDLFVSALGDIRWRSKHAHVAVSDADVATMNRAAAVVVGGGGLLLGDTNPNALSGWQWSCSFDALEAIRSPVVVFAVGYNLFPGQSRLGELFTRHVTRTVEKAAFVGLRNHGSVEAIRSYLPEDLHERIVYQPCMTTVLRCLYRDLFAEPAYPTSAIALNAAFDRADMRFGDAVDAKMAAIAEAMRRLSRDHEILYYAHAPGDERMLAPLHAAGVPHKLVRLYGSGARAVVDAYRTPALAIGMRGHSQLIPFGCGTPILSLVSHDKMRWFLDDIGHGEWGVDLGAGDLADAVEAKARTILADGEAAREAIGKAQWRLWDVTEANMAAIRTRLGGV